MDGPIDEMPGEQPNETPAEDSLSEETIQQYALEEPEPDAEATMANEPGEETVIQEPALEESEPDAEATTMSPAGEETVAQEPVGDEPAPDSEAATHRPSIYDEEEVEEAGGGFPILPVLLGGGAVVCGLALIVTAIVLIALPGVRRGNQAEEAPPTLERTLVFPTATVGPTEAPVETEEPEEEPEAETPEDETTPTAEPTATTAPAQVPTNPPPPPPPTDTPVPPPPSTIEGLTGVNFWVDNPVVAVNERISFNFSLTNSGADSIVFGPLGVAVQDAGGTTLAFHTSWTRWELEPEKTENWNDGVTIGNPGSYLLELSACIPTNGDHCDVSGGEWYALFAPIAVTVN